MISLNRTDTYHTLTLLTQDRVKEHFVLNQYINTTWRDIKDKNHGTSKEIVPILILRLDKEGKTTFP